MAVHFNSEILGVGLREDTNPQTCDKKVKNTFVLIHKIEEQLFFLFNMKPPDPHCLTIQTLLRQINGPPPKNNMKKK